MKRTAIFLGLACVCALFSCKKDLQTPVTDPSLSSKQNLALVTVNGVTTNTDTIPPTNAIEIHTLGVKGDGVTDDTQALQNAFNSKTALVFKGGTYIINTTLHLPAGVKIYGINGATIKSGNAMSGRLLTLGHFFEIENSNRNNIINMIFGQSAQDYSLGPWGTAVIYIKNSPYCNVSYCKFNFNIPYQHSGVQAIWCDGAGTFQTYICHNICNTVGIEYAESGASGTICMFNTINNSHSNALSGDGNGTVYCTGVKVCYNVINNAGYNGINDYGLIDGTLIRGNVINGSGKSPSEGALGEGIQAVAVNTVVTLNTISDAQAEYIECASTNKRIDSNAIIDTKFQMLGIVVNTKDPAQANAKSSVAQIDYNKIIGCLDAIEIYGGNPTSVNITHNTMTNFKNVGVNIISTSPVYTVNVSDNVFNITTPSIQTGTRSAILSYVATKTLTQLVNLTNNTITYATSANNGAGPERAINTCTNNATLIGNIVNGNSHSNRS